MKDAEEKLAGLAGAPIPALPSSLEIMLRGRRAIGAGGLLICRVFVVAVEALGNLGGSLGGNLAKLG